MRVNWLRRILLRILAWALDDVEQTRMHPLNRLIFHRSYEGVRAPFSHPQIEVGDHTYGLRRDCFFSYHPEDRVVIGKFCGIAQGVRFIFGEHQMNRVSTYPFDACCFEDSAHVDSESKGNIVIGNDVWIGANTTILSGVKIGDGAVIAAGAVVNKDVSPYSVVGGVPARHIKYKLNESQIESLLKIKWWDWPLEKIKENRELFYGDPNVFISKNQ